MAVAILLHRAHTFVRDAALLGVVVEASFLVKVVQALPVFYVAFLIGYWLGKA